MPTKPKPVVAKRKPVAAKPKPVEPAPGGEVTKGDWDPSRSQFYE